MKTTVVITGASSGIGRATAHAFARNGAAVVLASRRLGALEEVVAECKALGAEAIAVVTDVSDGEQVERLANAAITHFGTLDVWVNNASVAAYGSLLQIPVDDIRRVIDVNVMGYVYGAREALKAFQASGRGALINVASVIGEVPQPYSAPYSMSKAAVLALGVALRQEVELGEHKRISVSTVLPATTDTPFFRHAANYSGRALRAMPPVYPPEIVARAIVRASTRPQAEITIGAAGKAFVRGHRRHPRSVESQMARLTDAAQLSTREAAVNTAGNLYSLPPTDDGSVTGGWDGARRHSLRKQVGSVLLVGAGLLAALRVTKSSRSR